MAELPVSLTLATGKEVIQVSAQAELIETARSSTTDTIGERRIDNLPINGRNYIQFTLTDSQVQRDSAPTVGAAPTSGLNMSGQRARSNLVNVDGADATDNSVNGVRSTVSQEAVQEFQIISNSYAAEYGRASGGVVNIITRSGSNEFHGDVFGYLRNRNFQAVNPFSTVSNPAYTRVQAGAAFGGALKKDKTFYFFSVETTRRHETGFSSVQPATNPGYYGLQSFDTALTANGQVPLPFGAILVTPTQAGFLQTLTPAEVGLITLPNLENYVVLLGASSGMALQGAWPSQMVSVLTGGLLNAWSGFPTTTPPGSTYSSVPTSFRNLGSQAGNFPVFEGTTLYSLRLDHNLNNSNRLTLRVNASPSTVTGIEGSGQDQPFGQNAYSRTSQQVYRDVTGMVQETWAMGTNKVNEFRFQYARRGLSYFYNKDGMVGSFPAVNIPGFGYFGREPYSYIQRTEKRYQVTDNFSWAIGRHNTKLGADFNYLPVQAIFTVNYGGVYDFGDFSVDPNLPKLNPVQAYGAGLPGDYIQGLGNPRDSFRNIPVGVFWQDSWRLNPKLTLNYGVRYDVEVPPSFKPPQGLALPAYNLLGLQKGIQTDKNNVQPRVGLAWDPKGDGKTVVRASYGMFYDHPLLGLYFLGDASDGSSSGQLAFGPSQPCKAASTPYSPGNLNAASAFTGVLGNANCMPVSELGYTANQQRFSCPASDTSCGVTSPSNSLFLGQNYLVNPPAQFGGAAFPLVFQPFGYPQAKNFVFAYSQQANLTVERDLGHGFALSLAYNFNGGHHLNHPINANTVRGDLLVANWQAAYSDPTSGASHGPEAVGLAPGASFCGVNPHNGLPWVSPALTNFFRPGGINASFANLLLAQGGAAAQCVTAVLPAVMQYLHAIGYSTAGFNTACDPVTFVGCVPFGDMNANYSNGSSVYHGMSVNLRKRFGSHYEFLASYTWSHAIDDSTDLQSTLSPQDSYFPRLDRSNSIFDQRHRFVFSGVYQTGKLGGRGFASRFFSDWTFAPLVEISSGRPFNIITGVEDNFQLESKTGRPNTVANPSPLCTARDYPTYPSKYSPTGVLQEGCYQAFTPSSQDTTTFPFVTLLSLDGNLGRNAGLTPFTAFGDLRVAKKIHFGERFSMDLIADMFNIANKYNVAAVSPFFQNAGQATGAYDPRQFQFALKLNW
jgi:hypothetical protein